MTFSNFEKIGDIIKCKLILEDGSNFTIPMRNDGYIFATGLCKIVKKQVGGWLRLNETKELIKKLESDKLIHISQLVEVYKGNTSKYDQGTWIHPDLGIQLAQWCSPSFSLQVSKWIRELILTDKVELEKEKSNEELQEELNKIKNQLEEQIKLNVDFQKKTEEYMIEIGKKTEENQVLANKFVRLQKRETFPDNNVVYIVTNDELKKERIYLLGKAVDMKNRHNWVKINSDDLKHQWYHQNFENFSKIDKESNELVDLIGQYTKDGKLLINKFRTKSEAAEKTGSNSPHIGSCINGKKKYKTHNGFVWKKLENQNPIPKTDGEIEAELNKNIIKGSVRHENKTLHVIRKNGQKKKVLEHRFIYQIYNEGKISGCIVCGKDPSVFCIFDTKHDIDHIDGDHSNNDPKNLQRMCASCHSKKTNEQRLSKS